MQAQQSIRYFFTHTLNNELFFPKLHSKVPIAPLNLGKNAPLKLGIEKMPVQSIGGLESKNPSNPVHFVLASYTSLLSSWSLSDILSWLITLGSHS